MTSSLYRYGSSEASVVDVTDRGARDLGSVDVAGFAGDVDVADRSNRDLGQLDVVNEVDVNLAAQAQALATVLDAALASNATDTLRVSSPSSLDVAGTVTVGNTVPTGVENAAGTQVDPATEQSVATLTNAVTGESGIAFGRETVANAGTAAPLNGGTSRTLTGDKSVAIQAVPGNAGTVYVGDSTVTTGTGYPLGAGQVVALAVDDVATIHVDADNAGDNVAWIVEASN